MKHYDFIMAGGGLAGLSLAYHLIHSSLRESSILIIDKDTKDRNDRTWCFWTDRPTPFDDIIFRSWDRLRFVGEGFERVIDLGAYRYQMIRGIDFYRHVRQALSTRANVEFVRGAIDRIEDGADAARVSVGDRVYAGRWVFDSLFRPAEFEAAPARYRHLKQHFRGWVIEAQRATFDPRTPTLFDFRTLQDGALRFMYVLPFSERRALVEHTLFSAELLAREEYEQALREYIEKRLEIGEYRIVEDESGVIPMTDRPFPRCAGRRVLRIGTQGGRVKPSTGYAFLRIQRDSAAMVESLLRRGHPFDVPKDSAWYRLHDSIMLDVMAQQGGQAHSLFTALFRRNPVRRIFRFLDETGSLLNDVALLASLPPWPFLRALLRVYARRLDSFTHA
ncbi:MAG TPA: lycopene cyclase family protein [Anaerolineae bacterium]|nr:lycopene cyclase family protein [Anaerolineae bacterium]